MNALDSAGTGSPDRPGSPEAGQDASPVPGEVLEAQSGAEGLPSEPPDGTMYRLDGAGYAERNDTLSAELRGPAGYRWIVADVEEPMPWARAWREHLAHGRGPEELVRACEVADFRQHSVVLNSVSYRLAESLAETKGASSYRGDPQELANRLVDYLDECRRVLGTCRRLLDNLAENATSANLRRDATDLARRIVEVIGHPVYDLRAVEPTSPEPNGKPKSTPDLWAEVKRWHADHDPRSTLGEIAENGLGGPLGALCARLLDGWLDIDRITATYDQARDGLSKLAAEWRVEKEGLVAKVARLLEELGHWTSGRRRKGMPIVQSVPDGLQYAARLVRSKGTEGGEDHDTLLAEAGQRMKHLWDAASYLLAEQVTARAELADVRAGSQEALAEQIAQRQAAETAAAVFAGERDHARRERDEYRQLFDLQWTRVERAIAMWREEAPVERALVMPDLGALVEWLIQRGDQAVALAASRSRAAAELMAELDKIRAASR